MTTTTKGRTWLWPDHAIGKRESRTLREEHNALVNEHADLLEACRDLLDRAEQAQVVVENLISPAALPDQLWPRTARILKEGIDEARAVLAKAEGGQS